ncbi:hypothetical protein B0O80DRAFT_487784 [Mortierella sp. GBAus27b]|nr:hypothetical protein B0O80DRAFT_487784 [Mortierella sp. GBAus27b]
MAEWRIRPMWVLRGCYTIASSRAIESHAIQTMAPIACSYQHASYCFEAVSFPKARTTRAVISASSTIGRGRSAHADVHPRLPQVRPSGQVRSRCHREAGSCNLTSKATFSPPLAAPPGVLHGQGPPVALPLVARVFCAEDPRAVLPSLFPNYRLAKSTNRLAPPRNTTTKRPLTGGQAQD